MSQPSLQGTYSMLVDSATVKWPDNDGVRTPQDAAGPVKAAILVGFRLLTAHVAATTITIYEYDGTTVLTTIEIPANGPVSEPFPLYDRDARNGFSAKTSNAATTGEIAFIDRTPTSANA